MGKYEVDVSDVEIVEAAGSTVGTLKAKPPINATDFFINCVYGDESDGIDLRELFSSQDETVFIATSGRGEKDSQLDDLHVIANRIGRLASHPETAYTMMHETAFPESD